MPNRFLIVTADDFGLHVAVNEAVERASHSGILTATSLMVGEAASEDAVRRARLLPQLRVGLHVVLADGRSVLPAAQIPALVDAHSRFGSRMFVDGVRYFALPSVRRQLEREIRAQFQAFAATGLQLDHVNAHKHFHLHPTLMGMLLRIGQDYGLKMAGVRVPAEPRWASHSGAVLLAPWVALMKRRLRRAGIACNDHLFGVSATGRMDESQLLRILSRLPPGVTEIYLHPATRSGSDIAASMRGYRHSDELAALTSPQVREAMAALNATGTVCGGFADLPRSDGRRHAA